MTEQPLPGMPAPPPREPPKPRPGETFSRYKSARRLCEVCTFFIHRYGVGNAEYPRAARWRRAGPTETRYVCEQHKETRL